jgi:hypothetical protein
MKNKIQTYQIVHTSKTKKIVIEGPLLIEHIEKGVQKENAGCNTLDASINIYSVSKLEFFDLTNNKKIEEQSNYKVYELKSSGPLLSFQQETLHGSYPEISNAIFYISEFEQYGEITSWMPEGKLSWDSENKILTIL